MVPLLLAARAAPSRMSAIDPITKEAAEPEVELRSTCSNPTRTAPARQSDTPARVSMSGVSFVLATPRIDRARIARQRPCTPGDAVELVDSRGFAAGLVFAHARLKPFRVRAMSRSGAGACDAASSVAPISLRIWALPTSPASRPPSSASRRAKALSERAPGAAYQAGEARVRRHRECEAGDDVEPVVVACRDHGERDPRRPGEP